MTELVKTESKINNTQSKITVSLVVTVFVTLAISLFSYYKIKDVEAKLDQVPPVVVIDFVSLVDSYGDDLSPTELEVRMLETRDAVSALRDAGYLVLDASNIVAAPDDLMLSAAELGGK